jgi:acetyl esterase/lipase
MMTLAMATDAQQREDPPWVKEVARKRIVYQVPGMESVRVKRNLIYKHAPGRELEMDVYSPKNSRRPLPAVLFIHGGRIPANILTAPKDWAVYVSFGELVAASGFIGVTFNHRFYSWESLADSQSDVMDAIKYVREHAATLGVDTERIILWAISAGGIFLSQPLRDHPSFLTSIVAYYAELDLQNERASAPAAVTDETLRDFSPVYHLEKATLGRPPIFPPIFIARAGLDDADLNAGIDHFVRIALKNNLSLELLNHPTGHHGFDIEDNNERSREILKRSIEFIETHSARGSSRTLRN